ncbi:MAG: Crp/Fnr family transcriptional regulator [Salinivirgaceae bacterium]
MTESDKRLLSKLFDGQRSITYNRGETICKQGAIANQLMRITSGFAKIYIEHKGKNIILRIIRSNDIIGLHNLFHNQYFNFSATAITSCQVQSITSDELNAVFTKESTNFAAVIAHINEYAAGYFKRFISLTQKQVHGRLADAILHLSEDVYQSSSFELHLTRKDIAEYTGMSTESVIRIIKEFHNDKIIELDGKTLTIKSMKLLQKLSDLG